MNNEATKNMMSRRAALGTGAGFLLSLLGQSATLGARADSELFVFQASQSKALVIAVVFAANNIFFLPSRRSECKVRLHANARNWTINGRRSMRLGTISEHCGSRFFVGEVLGCNAANARMSYDAVVLETPPDFACAGGKWNIWAEILSEDGLRSRVGNPFVAEILARDPLLSKIYHVATPAQDRALFTGRLAECVAAMAAITGSVADSRAHGQRLATQLLPDVIEYRPELPMGFTFASQNGRHPTDNTAAVVHTVLTGAVTLRAASTRFRLCEAFPYFSRPTLAA